MTATEQWKPIPGFPGYEISDRGRIISYRRRNPKLMITPIGTRTGYRKVSLSLDGQRHHKTVHALVAAAFIGPRPDGAVIRHLDGDQLRNDVSNLAYGTSVENAQDRLRHGTDHYASRDRCKNGHAFDEENTAWRTTPATARRCRGCNRDQQRALRRRRAAQRAVASSSSAAA